MRCFVVHIVWVSSKQKKKKKKKKTVMSAADLKVSGSITPPSDSENTLDEPVSATIVCLLSLKLSLLLSTNLLIFCSRVVA
jgi:hypothetical protein